MAQSGEPVFVEMDQFGSESALKGRLAHADIIMARCSDGQTLMLWMRDPAEVWDRPDDLDEQELVVVVNDDAELAKLQRIVSELKQSG